MLCDIPHKVMRGLVLMTKLAEKRAKAMAESSIPDLYKPEGNATCSEAFYKFITEYDALMGYFFFVAGAYSACR